MLGNELWFMYEAKDVASARCYSKRLNTFDQWTAEVDIFPAASDAGVNATTVGSTIWLVGRVNYANDPNSVQYYFLP